MYLPCLTANLSLSFGGRYFVTVILSIVFKIDSSLEICSWLSHISNNPRRALSTPLIVTILIPSIPINEETSPSKPGRFLCISYSKYHSIIKCHSPCLLYTYVLYYMILR
ncbi:ACT domain protein [Bacillus pseudomycoides]|nr:ACT domain protein [Bacillus pseudomycoides]EEM08169.1 ACT domain protein [Bacillus pseudomycoides]EEM15928.1 ACT domain protein [Bacillus pseudomycoides DSM 12442]